MKRSKRIFLCVVVAILLAAVAAAVCVGLRVKPAVTYGLRISELLQPVTEAENQALHVSVSAEVNAEPIALESDVYLVREDEVRFLVLEQRGITLYISDHVLFLENGKAFRIGDPLQAQAVSWKDLLPHIVTLYETLNITAEETENETTYSITVTGDQVDTLLEIASFEKNLPLEAIQTLQLSLTEKNGRLDRIRFSGDGAMDGTSVRLNVTLSGFRVLASGDYPIPAAVKQSAATVEPDGLLSLSEDLYRLVVALTPFSDMASIDGTLTLAVDCGLIQLDTQLRLSELKTSGAGQLNPEQLQALPEMLGLVCMEGDLRCTSQAGADVYTLELNRQTMQDLARMILPELAEYAGSLTRGEVTIVLEADAVSSMRCTLEGEIGAWIVKVPIAIAVEFTL